MTTADPKPAHHWTQPANYASPYKARRDKNHGKRSVYDAQDAFERAVARELLGDSC